MARQEILELIPHVERWRQDGRQVALATVVSAYGSAPRPVGAKMAISSNQDMAGSVSGGCVEVAVVEVAQEVLSSGQPKTVEYGISQDMVWDVGLACGGTIRVFIEPLNW